MSNAGRIYPYKIALYYYSGKIVWKYIHAENRTDAFEKAHRFCNPFDLHDGVQFIEPTKLTKAYVAERNIEFDDEE